ncbi:MAG: DEAD/DEAH box helicase [Actinomycetota bacterium]|nr:DEAD/DEAH box helicase [Actinomycetota bacterium]
MAIKLHHLSDHHIRLYQHQCQAMEKISQGHNLIITTPTASGKTMAFNLPVFNMLIKDRQSTALYIYPTKALANDQLKKIRAMEEAMSLNFYSDIYDGDTSRARRTRIRSRSRVIITNPYQLHHSLSWHWKWESFFKILNT